MGRLGFTEILLILAIALLLFGAGRIADIGKGLGEGIRNFKKGLKDEDEPAPAPAPKELKAASDDEPAPKALPKKTAEDESKSA